MQKTYAWHVGVLCAVLGGSVLFSACSRDVQAVTPQQLEQQYGVSGAYIDTIATPDGRLRGTIVPVTLADGRRAELIIPARPADDPHAAYLRDDTGWHPVEVRDGASREELTQSATVVERRVERAHPRRRSWEKEALIIGGGAGGGALVGALAGGKKGAGVGAAAGGIGGLIYDLTTRHR
jgi:hypothetical protein